MTKYVHIYNQIYEFWLAAQEIYTWIRFIIIMILILLPLHQIGWGCWGFSIFIKLLYMFLCDIGFIIVMIHTAQKRILPIHHINLGLYPLWRSAQGVCVTSITTSRVPYTTSLTSTTPYLTCVVSIFTTSALYLIRKISMKLEWFYTITEGLFGV